MRGYMELYNALQFALKFAAVIFLTTNSEKLD